MKSAQLLIVGCGDLGTRVGMNWLKSGGVVCALCRRPDKLPPDFIGIEGDYSERSGLTGLEELCPDFMLFTPLPAGRDPNGYRRGFEDAVVALTQCGVFDAVKAAILLSSTRVYAEQDGAWVDEDSALTQSDPSALAIAAAEQRWLSACPQRGGVVLRASGIYGPNLGSSNPGMLLQRVLDGVSAADPARMSNRIHREDLARAVTFALERALSNEPLRGIYNCSDSEPAPIGEVETWLAHQLGVELHSDRNHKATGTIRGNRRVANQRLLATGFELRYPSFREGYTEVLAGLC